MRLLSVGFLAVVVLSCASTPHPTPEDAPAPPAFDEARAVHVLRRLAFGPSARSLADLRRLGVEGWVASQLDRPGAPLPPALDAKLQALPTLTMSMAELVRDYPPRKQREQALLDGRELERPARIGLEQSAAKLLRAVESPNQLEEVLVDFWFNHFNVSADKGAVRWMVTSYERDAIRPNVFGNFRELLGATARHPAMLFYLDNWRSTRDGMPERMAREAPLTDDDGEDSEPAAPMPGLNENYARELLELHTLGVDGGYTQQDVREVARCFTGWSIRRPRKAPAFFFRRRAHDAEDKQVLGHPIPGSRSEADGERVLDLLARHPSTARHVATRLARRFVSDTPPPALVERVAQVFLASKGDLPTVYRALFQAPEFWAEAARGAKVKTPFEFVVSALRATDAEVTVRPRLVQSLAKMGEPLFRAPAPTGFPEVSAPWVNSGSLVARLNFSLELVSGRMPGTKVSLRALATPAEPTEEAWVDALGQALLGAPPSQATRATILEALSQRAEAASAVGEARPVDVPLIAGLLLGSPEFQKQ
ncbi:DUF1800 domain-containing protein [Comamonas sp. JC664]|uniref:DUF1800 domain-containing protein n=1 Tax=Comamonas sp. JC664 TaxID=2801917 RepID=UPI00174DAE27|nr:DUF1800 domain-containing protein [Comamonas sp. JC664]MBL0694689.1 DUF1800 domain-containing protein [Comamonas sp. JC664]GHG94033.1 hypothetical protein GCM10012319_56660 [Comamonas sp. KCTC 72670]